MNGLMGPTVQVLDDRSLSLIVRDARDDGRKALELLRNHYLGVSRPRIISLYRDLSALELKHDKSVTDCLIRAEKAAASLKKAGDVGTDSLLEAMIIEGFTCCI